MDIELARTFLTIAQSGSFVRSAETLNVTQSTVSARIKVLEDQLGMAMFTRSKAGVTLTPAGGRFERHAQALVRIWQQARQEVSLPAEQDLLLTAGSQSSLWDGIMLDWLCRMRKVHRDIAIRTDVASNDVLMRQMVDGLLDIAVMYTPQTRPGLNIEQLLEETLIMVCTEPDRRVDNVDDYVYVDWGVEFRASHAKAFPAGEAASLFAGVGLLGLEFILRNGGSGYFPVRVVKPLLNEGRLHAVSKAPRFSRPAYLVHYPDDDNTALNLAVELLRKEGARANKVRLPR